MKKRLRILSFAVVFCMLLTLSACSGRTDVENGDSYIFGLNADRTGLIKVSYDISQEETGDAAEAMLEELKKASEEIEYTAAIPEDVEVQGCELKGSILDVDFSREYLEIENLEEKLMRAAVVQSLLRIEGIDGVSFTVDGVPLKDREGYLIGLMNEDDFVENTSYDCGVRITEGKIMEGAATTPSGMPADSIVYMIQFDDDPNGLTYKVSGFRRTGFPNDDF